jgi:hypothetical protein
MKMGLRSDWEFEYTAAKLAAAATAQRDFRIGRVEAWEAKKAEVLQKIKDSGISVSESLADLMGSTMPKYSNAGHGRGAHITIDSTLQDDLSECVEKIREHTRLRNEYAAWVQVLEANPEQRLKLHNDDWMFFFGK